MARKPGNSKPEQGSGSSAFLLAQVGAHAASRFAERLAELDLTPPQAGLLRAIAVEPGRSQQALAKQLGTPPPRLVALVDGLERRGVVQRRRNPDDRRLHAIHLTEAGGKLLSQLGRIAITHGQDITTALDDTERRQLHRLLARIAEQQELVAGVHPGYRTLGEASARARKPTC
ncbi:MAG: MarR family winged helix-turn-helix transcriptional regulator [Sciscionella sp.]